MNLITENGFTITDAIWFTPWSGECIGIVTGHSDHGEVKHYIGVGKGEDEKLDALHIAYQGARFYPEVFKENK